MSKREKVLIFLLAILLIYNANGFNLTKLDLTGCFWNGGFLILLLWLIEVSPKIYFVIGMVFLLLASLSILFGQIKLAESVANTAYFLLLAGLLLSIFREKQKQE